MEKAYLSPKIAGRLKPRPFLCSTECSRILIIGDLAFKKYIEIKVKTKIKIITLFAERIAARGIFLD